MFGIIAKQLFERPGETIAAFVANLCSLAEFCNFGALLEDMLWDQLVVV